MSTDIKFFNKRLANWIEEHHMTWPGWFHYNMVQGWFNICKLISDTQIRLKTEIILYDRSVEEKTLIRSAFFMVKNLKSLGIEGTHPRIIKPTHTEPITSVILNSENLKHRL